MITWKKCLSKKAGCAVTGSQLPWGVWGLIYCYRGLWGWPLVQGFVKKLVVCTPVQQTDNKYVFFFLVAAALKVRAESRGHRTHTRSKPFLALQSGKHKKQHKNEKEKFKPWTPSLHTSALRLKAGTKLLKGKKKKKKVRYSLPGICREQCGRTWLYREFNNSPLFEKTSLIAGWITS